ncbi:hypothetical protein [Streptomyces sp. NPDC048155]|uniref:hypothetical protein n=1 Tax=unclassified Streptomyces TaxID=2593676 RepID=UPI00340121A3
MRAIILWRWTLKVCRLGASFFSPGAIVPSGQMAGLAQQPSLPWSKAGWNVSVLAPTLPGRSGGGAAWAGAGEAGTSAAAGRAVVAPSTIRRTPESLTTAPELRHAQAAKSLCPPDSR